MGEQGVVSRIAEDKARGCVVTVAFFAVAILIYAILPTAAQRYYGIFLGVATVAVGVYASLRGHSVTFGLPFLPLWAFGALLLAVSFYNAFGYWGLFGSVPTALAAIFFALMKLAQAVPSTEPAEASETSEQAGVPPPGSDAS